jgi:DNA-directed RNA polymerase subunit RPC12/RpoP
VEDVRLIGSTGGPKAALDVRVTDLHIRGESLRAVAGAAGPTPAGKGWSAIALALSLVIAVTLGAVIAVRHGRRARTSAPAARAEAGADKPQHASPALSFPCAGCGAKLKARAALAGKQVKCPHCGKPLVVPGRKGGEETGISL